MESILLYGHLIGMIGLALGLRWWQKKHGSLGEKRVALIVCAYFSFFFTSLCVLLFLETNSNIVIILEVVFLLFSWGIGYPWMRWLLRNFSNLK
jgi:hypothetical protein